MKNILKKIGVFGLICAILSPYASLPKVNAETTDNCTHYLNNYLFLDVTNGNTWKQYSNETGYTTFTSYLYTFPNVASDEKIVIESVGEVPLDESNLLSSYFGNLKELTTESSKTLAKFGNYSTQKYSSYDEVTTIIHGFWGQEGESTDNAKWNKLGSSTNGFINSTIQGALIDAGKIGTPKATGFKSTVGAAYLNNDKKFYSTSGYTSENAMIEYFQKIVNDVSTEDTSSNSAITKKNVWKNNENYYINLSINRNVSTTNLNSLTFGARHLDSNNEPTNNYYIWSTTAGDDVEDVTDSYTAMVRYQRLEGNGNGTDGNLCSTTSPCYQVNVDLEDIDIKTWEEYYWPVSYQVEYSVCKTSNEVEGEWTLNYKEGVENVTEVTNMPSPKTVTYKKGETAIVTEKKPTRSGYAFNGWKLCNGETAYKAKDEIKNTEAGVVVDLCAQWGKEGTEENKKQGVISYVLGFAAVGLVAGGIYLISKKKDLFKQI